VRYDESVEPARRQLGAQRRQPAGGIGGGFGDGRHGRVDLVHGGKLGGIARRRKPARPTRPAAPPGASACAGEPIVHISYGINLSCC
jgi:hypothetical protein